GIGKAVLQAYLLCVQHTVIGAVREPTDATVQELQKLPTGDGSRLIVVKIDSKAYGDPAEAVKAIEAAGVSHIDIVVANAGGNRDKITPLDEITTDEVLDLFELNTVGPLALFKAVKPLLQKSTAPKWASVSSAAASISKLEAYRAHVAPAYGIAKAGLNWWTVAVHIDNPWLVCFALSPGLVQSDGGNATARYLGMEKAPVTLEDAAVALTSAVDKATREATSGKFLGTISGEEIPW
ncbi:NAD(P)-binding protein, partial [Thozetella sp. PMI_491]